MTGLRSSDCTQVTFDWDEITVLRTEENEKIETRVDSSEEQRKDTPWPGVWSKIQWETFKKNYDWLDCRNGKIGCVICESVKSLGAQGKEKLSISVEWSKYLVKESGNNRQSKLSNLRIKIKKHVESESHKIAIEISNTARKKAMEQSMEKITQHQETATTKIFRTVYHIAKLTRPFSDHDDLVELQQLNGVDLGTCLHSRHSATAIINHIAVNMRKQMVQRLLRDSTKISVLIDESTSLSKKSAMVVTIRAGIGEADPLFIFLDLVELEGQTAALVLDSLLFCLKQHGFSQEFLEKNWVGFASDGASVMTGKKSGVATRLKELFPHIVTWHCLNHRLELSISDAVADITAINHFQAFVDKLYSLYSQSAKNMRAVEAASKELGTQILRIGRVLGVRWIASSFRTVKAVWLSYQALHLHFQKAAIDTSLDQSARNTFTGLIKRLESPEFLCDLALMYDILHELSMLSLELQSKSISLPRAEHLIKRTIRVLDSHKDTPGEKRTEALAAKGAAVFRGIQLRENRKLTAINHVQFIQSVVDNMKLRLCSESDPSNSILLKDIEVLDTSSLNANAGCEISVRYGEAEVVRLSRRFQIDETQAIQGMRDLMDNPSSHPANLQQLMKAVKTLPCSTAECERSFSLMNVIVTKLRSSLTIQNVASLMFVCMNGPPIGKFQPEKYVKTWLQNHRTADDTRSKRLNNDIVGNKTEGIEELWKVF